MVVLRGKAEGRRVRQHREGLEDKAVEKGGLEECPGRGRIGEGRGVREQPRTRAERRPKHKVKPYAKRA